MNADKERAIERALGDVRVVDVPGFSPEVLANIEADHALANQLMEKDPKLPFVSAVTIAGDLRAVERAKGFLLDGTEAFMGALTSVGSYGRFEFIYWALGEGHVDAETVYALLPEYWPHSDPDDVDPRALALWKDAYEANGNVTILDDPAQPLPPGQVIRVYRGQDAGAPPGVSWTTDLAMAEAYAAGRATRQSNRGGVIIAVTIPRGYALAYLTSRGESEVIFDPALMPLKDPLNPRDMDRNSGGVV